MKEGEKEVKEKEKKIIIDGGREMRDKGRQRERQEEGWTERREGRKD